MATTAIHVVALDSQGLSERTEALAEILHACVRQGAAVGFLTPFDIDQARAFWRDKVAPGVAAGRRIVLTAELEERVAGTVQLDLDTPPNQPHRAEVAKLLVHPDFRRRGVGRALMAAVDARARAAGRRLLTLDTRTGDAAEPLYGALGYRRAGVIPDYALDPDGRGLHATTVMFKIVEPHA